MRRTTMGKAWIGLVLSAFFSTSIISPGPTYAGVLSDVSMPDTIEVGEHTLVLNGMGLRKKAIIKVYVAGLYLPKKMNQAKAIFGVDAPRRLVMEFKFGVSAARMCSAWEDGLAANMPNASQEVEHAFETLCGWMADMEKGIRWSSPTSPEKGFGSRSKE